MARVEKGEQFLEIGDKEEQFMRRDIVLSTAVSMLVLIGGLYGAARHHGSPSTKAANIAVAF